MSVAGSPNRDARPIGLRRCHVGGDSAEVPSNVKGNPTLQLFKEDRTMSAALQDLRVIDFTHALAGPFCVMLLGHLGADIIKVEPPGGGEVCRFWMKAGAPGEAYEALAINV